MNKLDTLLLQFLNKLKTAKNAIMMDKAKVLLVKDVSKNKVKKAHNKGKFNDKYEKSKWHIKKKRKKGKEKVAKNACLHCENVYHWKIKYKLYLIEVK